VWTSSGRCSCVKSDRKGEKGLLDDRRGQIKIVLSKGKRGEEMAFPLLKTKAGTEGRDTPEREV